MNDSKTTRRDLVRALGMGTGLALIAPLATRAGSVAYAASARAMGGRVGLELEGAFIALDGADGGNAFADVGVDAAMDGVVRKHLTSVRFEDIVLQVPLGAAQVFTPWIANTLAKGPQAKSGALVYLDANFKEVKRLEFLNAVITEVSLPACDSTVQARSDMSLTLRLTPTETRLVGGTGRNVNPNVKNAVPVYTASFRMNVQGFEPASRYIRKVSAPGVKRAAAATQPSKSDVVREKQVAAGALDCAPISLTLYESEAGPFYQWFNDFALRGNSNQERAGRLEYLSSDLTRTIATIDFGNLGIVRYAPLPLAEASGASGLSGNIALVQVDMFCETMSLTVA